MDLENLWKIKTKKNRLTRTSEQIDSLYVNLKLNFVLVHLFETIIFYFDSIQGLCMVVGIIA